MRVASFALAMKCSLIVRCRTSGVIPCGPDSYMVTSSGSGFGTAGVRTICL